TILTQGPDNWLLDCYVLILVRGCEVKAFIPRPAFFQGCEKF
ncbi:MAG: hypothetical protein ACI86C_002044, partial [Candidatus Latescibacterota bacterium]